MERTRDSRLIFGLAASLLTVFYLVGRIGMSLADYRDNFARLTWLNLILTAAAVFLLHRRWTTGFVLRLAFVALAGFAIEVAGVHTGIIFGEYDYGEVMGLKLMAVPVLIGLNWAVLAYGAAHTVARLPLPLFARIVAGAFLMVLIDLPMEPFAIRFRLWYWHGGEPPLQNYIAWFACSLLFVSLLMPSRFQPKNPMGTYVLGLEAVFFLSFLLAKW